MGVRTGSIIKNQLVINEDRAFGSTTAYIPALVENEVGDLHPALFTRDQIQAAVARARANPEDAPRPTWLKSLFSKVLD